MPLPTKKNYGGECKFHHSSIIPFHCFLKEWSFRNSIVTACVSALDLYFLQRWSLTTWEGVHPLIITKLGKPRDIFISRNASRHSQNPYQYFFNFMNKNSFYLSFKCLSVVKMLQLEFLNNHTTSFHVRGIDYVINPFIMSEVFLSL